MVGMEDARTKILDLLRDDVKMKRRAVISIVGMGGLGKTTLAKKVYNTIQLQSTGRFECVAWINVSQQYDALELLKEMARKVEAVTGDDAKIMSRDEVEKKLYESLLGKKYLVVMDDVWDSNAWDVFNAHLPDAGNGSRVLITSRFLQVARAADPGIPSILLRFLGDEESWELFSKKVYPHQDPDAAGCTGELRELGKQIAKKCGGLPLAIVVLGGMLSSKPKTAIVWQKLSQVIQWSEDGHLCKEILALSYDDLPYHLKNCFLYLGSFPEDYDISAEKLTRLWIVEGFVLPADGALAPEEIAEDYLEELIQRCLVQVVKRNSYGCVDRCRIHDLLHDLSIAEAKEIGFFECHGKGADELASDAAASSSAPSVRRLSFHRGMEEYYSIRHRRASPNLRTLLGFNFTEKPMKLRLRGLELLRVVDLEGAEVETLPEEIGNAVHLRYLGLRGTRIHCLPSSVGRLSRLQILDAAETPISKIPSSVWRIRSLRHLYVPPMVQPPEVLAALTLTQLRVLDSPRAGSWISQGLGGLTNLHKLGIASIRESHHTPLSSSLVSFTRLNSLYLEGGLIPPCALALPDCRRLYKIRLFGQLGKPPRPYSSDQLPPNLTELRLYHTRMDQDPMALLEPLRELKILVLSGAYTGKEMACSSGGFPSLQKLDMEYLERVEQWTVESGGMPRLQNLIIQGCRKLSMLPDGLQDMLDLQKFTLRKMPKEFILRVKEGEDWRKIRHVRSININPRIEIKIRIY